MAFTQKPLANGDWKISGAFALSMVDKDNLKDEARELHWRSPRTSRSTGTSTPTARAKGCTTARVSVALLLIESVEG